MSLLPDFPSSPTNGQVATVGDYSYTYNSTTDSWEGVLGGSSGSGTFAQVFTSNGTFTVPTGITAVKVTVIGGGGGGGGGESGGGGGGGGATTKYITGLTPGNSISVTVGSGGAGGFYTATGSTGGTSSFGVYCSATGGNGGVGALRTGGTGGTGSSGDINITGGNGGAGGSADNGGGQVISIPGAGGGSSGQDGQSGLSGYSPNYSGYQPIYNIGGTGFLGGAGGRSRILFWTESPRPGNAGTGYGNGGSGGSGVSQNGGVGSPGIVLVEWSASVLVVNTTTGGGIGYDQSWTDVSGSRTFGVSYTNSTEKPIQILVGASTTGAGGGVSLTINGVALPGSFAYSPSVTVFSATAIVPVGATYAASAYGGASYASWHELR